MFSRLRLPPEGVSIKPKGAISGAGIYLSESVCEGITEEDLTAARMLSAGLAHVGQLSEYRRENQKGEKNMPDETNQEQSQQQDPNQNYIETIQQLRNNTVAKEDYERLQKENKQLLETIVSGGRQEETKPTKDDLTKSINELRKQFKSGETMTNLEFAKAALKMRQQVLERDKRDIFVAPGSKYTPDQADYAAAQRVADVFQDCIDVSEDDPEIFTRELMRRTAGK